MGKIFGRMSALSQRTDSARAAEKEKKKARSTIGLFIAIAKAKYIESFHNPFTFYMPPKRLP